MDQKERIELLTRVVQGMGKLLGPESEVVLHDFLNDEVSCIVNGYITGRDSSYKINPSIRETIIGMADETGYLIGYGSGTSQGHKLRASHIVFKDENDQPVAMICVNQDVTQMDGIIGYLQKLVDVNPLNKDEDELEIETGENFVQKMTRKAILDAVDKAKPTDINSREGKMQILSILKSKGIFDVKDAVPYVCNILSISQATLYNYLRELRQEEAGGLIGKMKIK